MDDYGMRETLSFTPCPPSPRPPSRVPIFWFYSTELPKERADWLFTLAEYHKMLNNDAEQGRCLVEIYQGFKRCVVQVWCHPCFYLDRVERHDLV